MDLKAQFSFLILTKHTIPHPGQSGPSNIFAMKTLWKYLCCMQKSYKAKWQFKSLQ